MNRTVILIKRNLRLFIRDKAAVFFSFLSTIILVALYFLFIAKIYTNGMDNAENIGIGIPLTEAAKNFIVYSQMIAGVLILNSISMATGAFSTIAKDFENKRIDSLMLTPVKTHEIILAYFMTGFIASIVANAFTFLLSYVIIGISTGYWLSIATCLMVLVVLVAASLISCAIMLLVTTLIKSSTAIGVINGVLGTFLGFLCGIYMPYNNLGEASKAVGSFLPFSHLTVWLKQVMLDDAFVQIGISGEFKDLLYGDKYFSASSIGFCGLDVPLWTMLIISGVVGFLLLGISYFLLHKRIKRK